MSKGKTMKSYNLEVYRELRKDGFAAQAAIYYARHWSNNIY